MNDSGPLAKELIVKAQYFLPVEPKEEHLKGIQNKLAQIMMQEGYKQTDVDLDFFGPAQRSMNFVLIPPQPEKSRSGGLIGLLKPGDSQERNSLNQDDFLDGLRRARDDLPFRITFRFKTFREDEHEGYDLFVESTPVLLQKHRQLDLPEDYKYNTENIVDQNSREIQRILGRFELEPLRGPYTEAQTLDSRLSQSTVEQLNEHKYGKAAIQYINEGDQCLRQNLLHGALSCYIQGIEWLIIFYKIREDGEDIIQKQQEGDIKPVYFRELVKELERSPASQKTISKLNKFNGAERRWMAHHKSGQLERQDVENVRSTLFRLTNEIIE